VAKDCSTVAAADSGKTLTGLSERPNRVKQGQSSECKVTAK